MRIKCVVCERGALGPVEARKVRTAVGWSNVCGSCGAHYQAPPPGLTYHRRQQRQLRARVRRLELLGQLPLFPR